jgi:hypothetical protein
MHPDAVVFCDNEAATGLKMRDYYNWIQKQKSAK